MPKNKKNHRKNLNAQDVSKDDLELFLNAVESISDEDVAEKIVSEAGGAKERSRDSKPKRKEQTEQLKVDLHGKTLSEAISLLERELAEIESARRKVVIQVVTGKGRHSEAGGVLVKEVYGILMKKFSGSFDFLDSNPGDDLINGLPIRGYFRMRLK
jgi:DNA-nicking Smr family endonuclease